MDKIEKIRTEIERRKEQAKKHYDNAYSIGRCDAFSEMLNFIYGLEESEKPMNLEELEQEIDRFEDWMETYNQADYPTSFTTRDIARHFAQWGAEHLADARKMSPNDLEKVADEYEKANTGIYPEVGQTSIRDAFIDGYNLCKEQMMKKAVECDVIVPIYEGNDVWSAEIKIPGRYEPGDKVRVIIIPKEDEK